jgi:hypothetical protein
MEGVPMPKQKRHEILKRALVGAGAGAFLLGGVILLLPRGYSSSASLLFAMSVASSQSGGKATARSSAETAATGVAAGDASFVDKPSVPLLEGLLPVPQPGTSPATAALILTSRKSTMELIKRFDLDKVWHLSMERSIERFHRHFKCLPGDKGDLRIIFTDRSPYRSREVVDASIELLKRSVEDLSLDPAARNLKLVKQSLADAERDFLKIQRDMVKFQRRIGGIPPDAQIVSLGQTYRELQSDLLKAEAETAAARAGAGAAAKIGEEMIRAAQDPVGNHESLLSTLYSDVVEKEAALSLLSLKYTNKRPEVIESRREAEAARLKLSREVSRQITGIERGASPFVSQSVVLSVTAGARVAGLRQAFSRVRDQLRNLPEAQARYGQLLMDYEAEKSRLSLVRAEYIRAELLAKSRRGEQFVVFDPPMVPQRPDNKKLIFYMLIGALSGILIMTAKAAFSWLKQWMSYDYKGVEK